MLKIGHRGAAGYEPENTLRSFQKALDLGVDMIELDVQICGSGELVVVHDDDVDRTTDGSGLVSEMTYEEIRKLDAGQKEHIPLLTEVLDLVRRKVRVNIELKGLKTALPTAQTIKTYVAQKGWSYDDFLVSSFHRTELADFGYTLPQVKLGLLLVAVRPQKIPELVGDLNVYSVNIPQKFAFKKIVDQIHALGLAVLVWTVNDQEKIAELKTNGVEGVFSDFPERF